MNTCISRCCTIALLFCLSLLAGCAGNGYARPIEATPASPASDSSRSEVATPAVKPQGRQIVWTAELSVQVADVDKAVAELDAHIAELGGYAEEKSQFSYNGSSHSLVYRVPDEAFNRALREIEDSGEVMSRSVKGRDVTEQYVDLETRLKSNLALRDRYRELLDKAKDVKEVLLIEQELARVQAEIDVMEASSRALKDQIRMSTIRLKLVQKEPPVPPKPRTIYGPLGYLYKGAEWFVIKLFVIRE